MFFENVIPLDDALAQGTFPVLETFSSPLQSGSTHVGGIIRIVFPEFTCVCPKTGYPDFASIGLFYLPHALCIELKSWKLYLNAFRMVGTFHETVTQHLYTTIETLLKPKWLLVAGDFFPRGNVDTTVIIESSSPRPKAADFLLETFRPRVRGFNG